MGLSGNVNLSTIKLFFEGVINTLNFENKRVLVTGGFGFIGSHLINRLLEHHAKVAVLVRETSDPWRVKDRLKELEVYKADIRNRAEVLYIVQQFHPHYIFHLAAYGVNPKQKDDLEALQVNVFGTMNIVHAAMEVGCLRVINLGSSSEYGDKRGIIHEDEGLAPVDLYGSTKAAATIISHQMARVGGLSIVTLRPFNIFGEGDDPEKLFSYIITRLLNNQEVQLTSCKQHRDYCYVENIIDGMLLTVLEPSIQNEIFNIGSGDVFPLSYFVSLIYHHMDVKQAPQFGTRPERINERQSPVPDLSKIEAVLNWKPTVTLEEGMIRTIEWYKSKLSRTIISEGENGDV